ncbi:GNAT family N-acetyltransferase [Planococcus beigongshangi]|uniref:GNAT family N-acetyltransferase n=1 Tax=Planococcus beigongshangi TaxID=2782536 RepID=UPI00193B886A|nr:GNAT family protein [Planococcus beigongshangi]
MFSYKIDEELSLKLVEVRDSERIFELTDTSRDYLKEWLPWLDYTKTVEDSRDFIRMSRKNYADNKTLNTVIVYQDEIVGMAGFNELGWVNKTAKIGYWLGQEYQGNGIMTRVAEALTDISFGHFGMNRTEIRVATGNVKSRGIPERLGYTEEGTLRQVEWLYDHYVDHVVYGMLASEWKK